MQRDANRVNGTAQERERSIMLLRIRILVEVSSRVLGRSWICKEQCNVLMNCPVFTASSQRA